MSEPLEQAEPQPRKRDLREAIRRVRLVSTEQADGLADLRDTERARLQLLADGLADLFAVVPDDLDFFTFGLSNGETPRLWIDMTCHVAMGRDRRTYRLLKDTRLGRTLLHETIDRDEMADRITDYVAGRVLDRERAIEGDWIELRKRATHTALPDAPGLDRVAVASPPAPAPELLKQPEPGDAANEDFRSDRPRLAMRRPAVAPRPHEGGVKWVALFIGVLIGVGALAGWMMAAGKL